MRTRRNLPGMMIDFPSVVNDLFSDELFKPVSRHNWYNKPSVNIMEDDNTFGLELVAPGFEKDQFNIRVEDNTLIIEGEAKEVKKEDEPKYKHREFTHMSFTRRFALPEKEIIEDGIHANYENGILKILLPKSEEAKPKAPKMIAIQ